MRKCKWTPQQIAYLLDKTREGKVRTHAFCKVAQELGRKPNSVRNFYYSLIKSENLPATYADQVTKKFYKFTKLEISSLLREVVLGTSRGESVRASCARLARGDSKRLLRLQNKYRTIALRSPQLITQVVSDLSEDGYFVRNPIKSTSFYKNAKTRKNIRTEVAYPQHSKTIKFTGAQDNKIITMPIKDNSRLTDEDINNLFMGLVRLIKNNSNGEVAKLESRIAELKNEIERLKKLASHSSRTK